MAKRKSLGTCPRCRRQLWRPVQTVRAKDRVYHLACWRETKPPVPRPEPVTLSDALARLDPGRVLPEHPLPRAETLAILLEMPMAQWVRRRLEQAQKST
jgi:hypothetical protein